MKHANDNKDTETEIADRLAEHTHGRFSRNDHVTDHTTPFALGRVHDLVWRNEMWKVEVVLDDDPGEGVDFEGPFGRENTYFGYFDPKHLDKFSYEQFYYDHVTGLKEEFAEAEALVVKHM